MTGNDERQEQDRPADGAENENDEPETSRPDTTPDGEYVIEQDQIRQPEGPGAP